MKYEAIILIALCFTHPSLQRSITEPTEDCPKFCTFEYEPVCGVDNTGNMITFGNKCGFKSYQCENRDAGWKILGDGECNLKKNLENNVEEECPKVCTLEYVPVCGVDNTGNRHTFGNLCSFKSFQCENRDAGWTILGNGECELKRILENDECPKVCTVEYAPVCGVDNTGNQQTFGNSCFFKSFQCENRDAGWKILGNGECELKTILENNVNDDCPKVCTLEYVPVCGVDNTGNRHTFGNLCSFKSFQCENRDAGWKILGNGECELKRILENDECPKVCTVEYAPVCGVDNTGNQQTFGNSCFFKSFQCENRDAGWKILGNGECQLKTILEDNLNDDCPKICTLEYVPVCGVDNTGNRHTFGNLCSFKSFQCENRDAGWKILGNGECQLKRILENDECPKVCTLEYAPVCGVDNTGNQQTFGNLCSFKSFQCENRDAGWKILGTGQCQLKTILQDNVNDDCPRVCTMEFAPVCGVDNTGNHQTFGNLCSFKSFQCENRDAGWKILGNGECQLKQILKNEECPKICTLEFVPVCGVDNTGNRQTFANKCFFEHQQCENRAAGWKVLHNGVCDADLKNQNTEECPKMCTREWAPVCGVDNTGKYQTFGNLCTFKNQQCENRDAGWKILNNGECNLKQILRGSEECPKFCTEEYAPVCGLDNTGNQKTFGNKCFFATHQCENRAAGWKVLHAGTCKQKRSVQEQEENEDCPKFCTLEYAPVCGMDNTGNQQTFGNLCSFKSFQCENRAAGWKVLNHGECGLPKELTNEEDCPKICTLEYAPICGMDNTGNQLTFGNLCSFKSFQCENRAAGWKVLNHGECGLHKEVAKEEDCPKICTLEYAPVCGMDNTGNQQTFGNLCSFKSFQCENRAAGWKVLNHGECGLPKELANEEDCPQICTLEYAPVCGMDNTGIQQTFGNLCFFKSFQCENRVAGWKILNKGEC